MQTISISPVTFTAKYTVRVQVPQVKELSNKKILKEIKKIISETTVI